MKKLLAIVVLGLCLITPSLADDISDFEIEGMSIGDSLLNLNMSYEQMILSVADNGLSSQRIHFSTNSIKGKN